MFYPICPKFKVPTWYPHTFGTFSRLSSSFCTSIVVYSLPSMPSTYASRLLSYSIPCYRLVSKYISKEGDMIISKEICAYSEPDANQKTPVEKLGYCSSAANVTWSTWRLPSSSVLLCGTLTEPYSYLYSWAHSWQAHRGTSPAELPRSQTLELGVYSAVRRVFLPLS